ncbi:TIR domain-containing protein [Desulfobacter curvatus]|nr:TIR domain-containing protein [Desulfobacter curvatus]
MIDVFISYGSEDRLKAAILAELFSEIGWNVWWDKKILGGDEWSSVR